MEPPLAKGDVHYFTRTAQDGGLTNALANFSGIIARAVFVDFIL